MAFIMAFNEKPGRYNCTKGGNVITAITRTLILSLFYSTDRL